MNENTAGPDEVGAKIQEAANKIYDKILGFSRTEAVYSAFVESINEIQLGADDPETRDAVVFGDVTVQQLHEQAPDWINSPSVTRMLIAAFSGRLARSLLHSAQDYTNLLGAMVDLMSGGEPNGAGADKIGSAIVLRLMTETTIETELYAKYVAGRVVPLAADDADPCAAFTAEQIVKQLGAVAGMIGDLQQGTSLAQMGGLETRTLH